MSIAIDTTFWELLKPETMLETVFPLVYYPDPTLVLATIQGDKPTVASLVAPEQDIPIHSKAVELTISTFDPLKAGKKYHFANADFKVEEQMQIAIAENRPLAQFQSYFFRRAEDMITAINEKALLLAAQTLTTGTATYTDPLTGLRWGVTYPDTIPALLPGALTGGDLWSAPATANGLENLELHSEEFYDQFGKYPDMIFLRRKNFRQLRRQESTMRAWYQTVGAPTAADTDFTNVNVPDQALLDLIRARTNVERIEIVDYRVKEESAIGTPTEVAVFPEDFYLFVERGNIERAIVPTWEGKRFGKSSATERAVRLSPENVPYFVVAEVEQTVPRRETITGVGNVIPLVKDARKIAARKIA